MRIGIDATPLPPNPVGAGNYIIHLLRVLASLETEHEFIVFAQQNGRELIDVPEKPNFKWITLPNRNPGRRLLWEQIALPGLVRSAGVDLLHSLHYTRPVVLSCASVVTFHDMTFFLFPELHTQAKRVFFPLAMRFSARKANALLSVSESTRRDAIRLLHIPPDKIFTTPLGVDEEFHLITDASLLEACRRRYNLPAKFILFVGLLEPRKNLPLLLKAYAKSSKLSVIPPLVIVGRQGWGYEEIIQQIDTLDLKARVHFTGYVPAQDLPFVYNLAQVFVYPSIYEGFGLPPLEAMACGTPAITTDVSAMRDHVGDAGILIPSQDEEALALAIQKILNDQELRRELSIKSRQQAANFTWKRTALETLKVYQYVASKQASKSLSVL